MIYLAVRGMGQRSIGRVFWSLAPISFIDGYSYANFLVKILRILNNLRIIGCENTC